MKKYLQILFVSITMLTAFNFGSSAQTLIHYWDFNNLAYAMHTDTIHGIDADYSDLDTSKAKILYAEMPGVSATFATYVDSVIPSASAPDYDTVNLQASVPSGSALRVRNPSDSMYLLFYIPTTHFKNIVLKYGSESSSITHGMLHQLFDYSVDSGLTWKTSGLSIPSDSAWLFFHLTTVSFATDTNVNNNPKMVFRITFSGNTSGTSGNNRFDNVTVEGDTILGTSSVNQVLAIAPSYTLYPNPALNALVINANTDGTKEIRIYNTIGQNVYTDLKEGKNIALNISDLNCGTYLITITEKLTGNVTRMKFAKQ